MTPWPHEYMASFPEPDPLVALALEYLKNTEDHDHCVCRHRKGNMAIPVTPEERTLCTRFAQAEYSRLLEIAHSLGCHGLWETIQREERHFTETYVPPPISVDTEPHCGET